MEKRFSIGKKIYLFVIITVIAVAFGTAGVSYAVNAGQIDRYYKQLATDSATTFASFVDPEFFKELRAAAESEEFQELRDLAEEHDDESMIREYLEEHGLWERYEQQRALLMQYLSNMSAIEYLYIQALGGSEDIYDMYLMDDTDNPLYETGYYEDREVELYGIDTSKEIEPSISHGEWGYLCSAWMPVYDKSGEIVCHVGCDVSMDELNQERLRYFAMIILSALLFTMVVLFFAVLFARKVMVMPLNAITKEMKKFKPSENIEDANVIDLNITSNDEIQDIYQGIRTMQLDLVGQIQRISAMRSEQAKKDTEISIAGKMQEDLLPRHFPDRSDFSLRASLTPSKEMGGSFYDFFLIDNTRYGLIMVDVSGNGIPTALMMIVAKTLLRTRTLAGGSPSRVLSDVNRTLCADNPAGLSVTVWLGIYDPSSKELTYSYAGSEQMALSQKGDIYKLYSAEAQQALGIDRGVRYDENTLQLQPGDRLFLYSAGIPEARNINSKRYGMDEMTKILNDSRTVDPYMSLDRIKNSVLSFVGDNDLTEDVMMMLLSLPRD